jgi:hypothetical protein
MTKLKITKAMRDRRVEWVLARLLDGALTHDLVAMTGVDGLPFPAGHGKAWNVKADTIRHYARDAGDLLAKSAEESRPRLVGYHHATRRVLFNKCMAVGDYRAALAALDSEAKLLGLFAPPPPPADPSGMTDDALDAEVAAILAPAPEGEAGGATGGEAEEA